jgi:hypothetical protein
MVGSVLGRWKLTAERRFNEEIEREKMRLERQ